MKIAITGISGQLGSNLAGILLPNHEVTGIDLDTSYAGCKVVNVDICDWKNTYEAVSRLNPDILLHCAANTDVDGCEKNPDSAYLINGAGTRNLAVACQRFDTVMLYMSTDYVFSGINPPEGGYREPDITGPASVYGKSKLEGELYVEKLLNKYFIVRTSWLFGAQRPNFITQIAQSLKNGTEIKAVSDMVSAPTYVADLSKALSALIETPLYGTYHITNTGFVSRYEIAEIISKMMKKENKNIKKMTLKELGLAAPRPAFSGLCGRKWVLDKFPPLRNWHDAVQEFLREKDYI